jgi:mevalonate kinase
MELPQLEFVWVLLDGRDPSAGKVFLEADMAYREHYGRSYADPRLVIDDGDGKIAKLEAEIKTMIYKCKQKIGEAFDRKEECMLQHLHKISDENKRRLQEQMDLNTNVIHRCLDVTEATRDQMTR